MNDSRFLHGECIEEMQKLDEGSVQCVVTSPPYFGLRDYGEPHQLGLEEQPDCLGWATGHRCGGCYVCHMVDVFREVWRVLANDGVTWLNLGDTYAANRSYQAPSTKGGAKHSPAQGFDGSGMRVPEGLKQKDLIGIPWRVALALQADGWILRQDVVWAKPNPMPESVRDRCTKAHEYIFLLAKQSKYYYDHEAVKEDAAVEKRNRRSVWWVPTKPFKGAHFAVYPYELIEPCILAGSREGDTVLDPFSGAGTTGLVATDHGRRYIGIDASLEYTEMGEQRLAEWRNRCST